MRRLEPVIDVLALGIGWLTVALLIVAVVVLVVWVLIEGVDVLWTS
jgi:hypothetical protein